MKDHKKKFSIEKMAKIFQVSRGGYYKFLQRKPSKRDVESNRLIKKIREIYKNEYFRSLRPEHVSALPRKIADVISKINDWLRSHTRLI